MPAYQSENGRWYCAFYYEDCNGVRNRKCKRSFESREEAEAWEEEFKESAKHPENLGFGAFAEHYLKEVRPRIRWSTYETKSNGMRKWIIPFFKQKTLSSITSLDVLHWQGWLSNQKMKNGKPLSATYVRKLNSELSAIFNYAERHFGLTPNPTKKVAKTGKTKADEMQIWTKAEYSKFIDAVCDKAKSFYAFEILYWTGIREGELLALTPADFDFKRCTLKIDKSFAKRGREDVIGPPKTERSYRTITISSFLANEIKDYIERTLKIEEDERIFNGMTKHFLYHEMERGCAISGVKRIRVHDLRHSHVSMLIQMGFSAVAIAERMGHESTDITFRYAHLFPNSQENMADALQELRNRSRQ